MFYIYKESEEEGKDNQRKEDNEQITIKGEDKVKDNAACLRNWKDGTIKEGQKRMG